MSIFVYILYVWFSHFWEQSLVRYSVVQLHQSPLFWLSIMLVGGTAFCGDMAIEFFRMHYFKNASDYVRELLESKEGMHVESGGNVEITDTDIEELKAFMVPINKHYRDKDKRREARLQKKRNAMVAI